MLRFFAFSLLFCPCWLAAQATVPVLPPALEPLPPILHQWAGAQQKVGDIHVRFQQTRTVPALKEPVTAQGQFWRFRDGAFRWEVGDPPVTTLLYDLKEFCVRDPSAPEWQILSPKDGRYRMWAQFLSGDDVTLDSLRKNFTARVGAQTQEAVTVSLMPRPLVVKRHLRQIDLIIHPGDLRLRGLRIEQADGAAVQMDFAGPRKIAPAQRAVLLHR